MKIIAALLLLAATAFPALAQQSVNLPPKTSFTPAGLNRALDDYARLAPEGVAYLLKNPQDVPKAFPQPQLADAFRQRYGIATLSQQVPDT